MESRLFTLLIFFTYTVKSLKTDTQIRQTPLFCILMYKVKHNLCPRTVCNIFKTSNHSYSLRQTDFYLPNFNIVTYGKHSLRYLGPKLWSKLSSSERSSTSLYNFKLQIRKRDFNNILEGCNSCHLCNS